MQIRPDAFSNKYGGGDATQLEKTRSELIKLGVSVDVSTELQPDLSSYDIVHLFNITRIQETYIHAQNCLRQRKPYVLSTIHHSKKDIEEYEQNGLYGIYKLIARVFHKESIIQNVKSIAYTLQSKEGFMPLITQLKTGFLKEQLFVLENAVMLLPNSLSEANTINDEFNRNFSNYIIIPNGVEIDDNIINVDSKIWYDKYGLKDFIICPGRIEPLKNQINIIKAIGDKGIKIVFAGGMNEKHRKYCNEFMKLVNNYPNLHYVGKLQREMLFSAYKNAKVCVLASWFETTGLVGLEAGILDSNVVITNKGYTKDYYKELAWYCEPDNIDSIRKSVLSAYDCKRGYYPLKDYILKNFTWEKAARLTLDAYNRVLNILNR